MAIFQGRAYNFPMFLPAEGTSLLGISSVTVLGPTSIRVNFENPVVNNIPLRATESYELTPSLTVHSVTPESVVSPTYVDLVIDEQNTSTAYTVELVRIQAA